MFNSDQLQRRATAFWNNVDRGEEGECWPWQRAKESQGYGVFSLGGKSHGAHRIAYALAHGADAIKPGLMVRHRCHNPSCVNPEHLVLGNQRENVDDSVRDGRFAHGVRNGGSKLDEDAVREIRREAGTWDGMCAMMLKHRVSQAQVMAIHRRQWWRHLPD